jgi:glyoxylase-like metal-dependent hydrolase (beta-lactamase superfamily II)
MNTLELDKKVLPFNVGHVNIYLIETDRGYILVDTGMPDSNKKIDTAFKKFGVDPKSVHLIILTHGHLDHVGSAAYAQQVTGGKVLCHKSFAKDLADGKIEIAVPQNFKGRVLDFITGFLGSQIGAVNPDIVMDDEFDLGEFGISGKVIHTPGHSQSSISIDLDNGEVLVGDLLREEKTGVVGLGMFYEDEQIAFDSVQKIAAMKPSILYLSHNTTIDNQMLIDFITNY